MGDRWEKMRIALAAAVFLLSGGTAMADCNHPKLIEFSPSANAVALNSGPPTEAVDCYQVIGRAGPVEGITPVMGFSAAAPMSEACFTVPNMIWSNLFG